MDIDTQETIAEFLKENPVSMTLQEVPGNPNMNEGEFSMYHWHVVFEFEGRSMQTHYSTGCGHNTGRSRTIKGRFPMVPSWQVKQYLGYHSAKATPWIVKHVAPKKPECADILDCLASDSDVLNYSTFEDWADCMGMDTDSRKEEKTYRICIEQALRLRELLRHKPFNRLLECERL